MDLDTAITLLCGLAMVVGVIGVVVPVLPGLLLCWLSVLVWAIFTDAGGGKWLVLSLATVTGLVGWLAKYLWSGKKLQQSGVPTAALLLGSVLAVAGFFLVPVVGLVVGFVAGIWLAELARLKDARTAWGSAWHGIKAVGLAMLIELFAAVCIAVVWVAGLILA